MPLRNDEELRLAALALCKTRNLDPNERVPVECPKGHAVQLFATNQDLMAREIERHLEIFRAVRQVQKGAINHD